MQYILHNLPKVPKKPKYFNNLPADEWEKVFEHRKNFKKDAITGEYQRIAEDLYELKITSNGRKVNMFMIYLDNIYHTIFLGMELLVN